MNTTTSTLAFICRQWVGETINPLTGEVVTINIHDASVGGFNGRIGQASGEFTWGQQVDAPWVTLYFSHREGTVTMEETEGTISGNGEVVLRNEDEEITAVITNKGTWFATGEFAEDMMGKLLVELKMNDGRRCYLPNDFCQQ